MGITSFRQVARFTPEDVAIVNEALDVFPGRIERDDWMASARELHREVYGIEP
jgi:predicted flap endonuclease-1-like 5' DNA nuclease